MASAELGSYQGNVSAGDEILELIYADIESKIGRRVAGKTLRHVTIYGNTGDIYSVNGYNFELKNGEWSSPNNDSSTLVEIRSLKASQSGMVNIYYLR